MFRVFPFLEGKLRLEKCDGGGGGISRLADALLGPHASPPFSPYFCVFLQSFHSGRRVLGFDRKGDGYDHFLFLDVKLISILGGGVWDLGHKEKDTLRMRLTVTLSVLEGVFCWRWSLTLFVSRGDVPFYVCLTFSCA